MREPRIKFARQGDVSQVCQQAHDVLQAGKLRRSSIWMTGLRSNNLFCETNVSAWSLSNRQGAIISNLDCQSTYCTPKLEDRLTLDILATKYLPFEMIGSSKFMVDLHDVENAIRSSSPQQVVSRLTVAESLRRLSDARFYIRVFHPTDGERALSFHLIDMDYLLSVRNPNLKHKYVVFINLTPQSKLLVNGVDLACLFFMEGD